MAAGQAYTQLREHLHTTQLLGGIQSTLYYDQNTAMPAASSSWRGEQLVLLSLQLHVRQTSAGYADLLVSSQTGRGKTAAFLLPVLHTLLGQQAAAAEEARLDPREGPDVGRL